VGETTMQGSERRIILLLGSHTYRANPFVAAAQRLGLEVIKGLDLPAQLGEMWQVTLPLDFKDPDQAVARLVAYAREHPVRAILSVDDGATLIAARACAELGLSHNSPEASLAARNKHVMRQALSKAGVPVPGFQLFGCDDDPAQIARTVRYPCVVKPLLLSGSQGVIRADDPDDFVAAFRRTRSIVLCTGGEQDNGGTAHVLVEDYLPGDEVVLEGILAQGRLKVLALFDKPDPLVGPFFEETLYVTPSRHPEAIQRAIVDCAARACAGLGLREGPVHAEIRINDAGAWLVEAAGRSIGGLCSRILRFGTADISLEEVILRQAMGLEIDALRRESRAGGVMMIPIPKAGILKRVEGLEEARAVEGIEEIEIAIRPGYPVVPLPEGSSYLGFIFARGETPERVEAALREAHRRLRFAIGTGLPMLVSAPARVGTHGDRSP
jgi:biotin carboxylase